jgi:hypothetical protein
MTNLIQALIESGQCQNKIDAMAAVAEMNDRVMQGENPEDILDEYNLEPDYVEDLLAYQGESKKTNQASSNKDSLAKKIQALMDKANSTDSLAERESFMTKAQELILKNNVSSERLIAVKGGLSSQGEIEENIIEEYVKYEDVWDRDLIVAVLKNNMCKHLYNTSQSYVIVIGKESNVNMVVGLFKNYMKAILGFAIQTYNYKLSTYHEADLPANKIKKFENEKLNFLRDYLNGAVNGLKLKLEGKMETFLFETDEEFEQGAGLILSRREVVRNNIDRIEKWIDRKYGGMLGRANLSSSRANTSSSAFKQGTRDGAAVAGGAGGRRMIG